MKLETIMNKIQEADMTLALLQVETSYNFAIDINTALKKLGHFSIMYYNKCELKGMTYQEATELLGKHLRQGLGMEETTNEEQAH